MLPYFRWSRCSSSQLLGCDRAWMYFLDIKGSSDLVSAVIVDDFIVFVVVVLDIGASAGGGVLLASFGFVGASV